MAWRPSASLAQVLLSDHEADPILWQLQELERAKGIEPSYAAWDAAVLPLNYARVLRIGRETPAE
jgi:hypothetical protein